MSSYIPNELVLTLRTTAEVATLESFALEESLSSFNRSVPHYFNEQEEHSPVRKFIGIEAESSSLDTLNTLIAPFDPSIYRVFIPERTFQEARKRIDDTPPATAADLCKIYKEEAKKFPDYTEDERLLSISRTYKISFGKSAPVLELSEELTTRENLKNLVASAHPNYLVATCCDPVTLSRPAPWWFDAINVQEAWSKWNTLADDQCPKVLIGIIDSGIRHKHPAFEDKIEASCDFVHIAELPGGYRFASPNPDRFCADADPDDDDGHGTHCAGIAAALPQSNGTAKAIAGVCPWARILPVRAFISMINNGKRKAYGDVLDIAVAIKYAADHKAQVLNMSFALKKPDPTLSKAIAYAYHAKQVCMVAAVGNDEGSEKRYPAAFDNVLAVGAIRKKHSGILEHYTKSNWGFVDVVAPGVSIYSTDINEETYKKRSGTSMATPFVSGLVALIISLNRARQANGAAALSVNDIYALIRDNANKNHSLYDQATWGAGLIDIYETLRNI